LLFLRLKTCFHLLSAMCQNLLCFLQILYLKLLTVQFSLLLFQVLLNILLHIFQDLDLVTLAKLAFIVLFRRLTLSSFLSDEHLFLLVESFFLPSECLHIILKFVDDSFELFDLSRLFSVDFVNLKILLVLLHRQLLFVNHFQLVTFLFAFFVVFLDAREVSFKFLE